MHRTTILLPEDLRREATKAARQQGISLSELIRKQLTKALGETRSFAREADVLFHPQSLLNKRAPGDLASNHDEYLHEDEEPL